MRAIAVTLIICIVSGANANNTGKDHPIVKVINLLKGLKEKTVAEAQSEAVAYNKFQFWCVSSSDKLRKAISNEKETIAELEDKRDGLSNEESSLAVEIDKLTNQKVDIDRDLDNRKDQRKTTQDLYTEADNDLEATIKAIDKAIVELSGAEGKTEAQMLLAQSHVKTVLSLAGPKVTEEQRHRLQASFLQWSSAAKSKADPKKRPKQLVEDDLAKHVDKYDFKSENILELLKGLKMRFQDEQLEGTKEESSSQSSHQLATQAAKASRAAVKKAWDAREKEHSSTVTSLTETKATLKTVQEDLASDSKTLTDTTQACRMKESEWEQRSSTRDKEIEAMDQAVEILSKSTGLRHETPSNPIPPPSPAMLLQLSESEVSDDPKMRAVVLLKETAKDAKSKALERFAIELSAHLNGPFQSLENMIEKMVFHLMDEQKQEDEHKKWCDQELEKTQAMKTDKTDKASDLTAEINVQISKMQKLKDEIADADALVTQILTFMGDATEIRQTGKKENALAIKDAKAAQDSLSNAIAVLEAFYKETGEIRKEPWEFIQMPVNLGDSPSTWGASYKDAEQQPGGVISVLKGVLESFSTMEAETTSQEAEDQKEYEITMNDNKIKQAEQKREVQVKTTERARRADRVNSLEAQKKNVEAELEKTEQYFEDLQPACVEGDSKYGDRKKSRTKEINALHKAQNILADAFKETAAKSAGAALLDLATDPAPVAPTMDLEEKSKKFMEIYGH
jgi:hypothetical protein